MIWSVLRGSLPKPQRQRSSCVTFATLKVVNDEFTEKVAAGFSNKS